MSAQHYAIIAFDSQREYIAFGNINNHLGEATPASGSNVPGGNLHNIIIEYCRVHAIFGAAGLAVRAMICELHPLEFGGLGVVGWLLIVVVVMR